MAELKLFHTTEEMNAHPTWGDDSRANSARCVQRAFCWVKTRWPAPRPETSKAIQPTAA